MAGRTFTCALVGAAAVAALCLATPGADGTPAAHRVEHLTATRGSAVTVAGISGELAVVTAVPHSSDVFAIADIGEYPDTKYALLRRHHGHWAKIKTPSLGGPYGHLDSLTAGSPSSVFLGGGVQVGPGNKDIQDHPTIWRFAGSKFVKMKFPATEEGADGVASLSAGSPSNVWAGGGIFAPDDNEYVAHWDGHSWKLVVFPRGGCGEANFAAVSTSSPSNAWAYTIDTEGCEEGNALLHWDGSSWTAASVDLTGDNIFGIATSGPKVAYAVGETSTAGIVILRWNGKTWTKAKLAGGTKKDVLFKVAMHGKSAWAIGENAKRHAVILHTSGGKWTPQSAGSGPIFLNAIAAISAKRAIAVGTLDRKTFVDYYNGHKWVPESS